MEYNIAPSTIKDALDNQGVKVCPQRLAQALDADASYGFRHEGSPEAVIAHNLDRVRCIGEQIGIVVCEGSQTETHSSFLGLRRIETAVCPNPELALAASETLPTIAQIHYAEENDRLPAMI